VRPSYGHPFPSLGSCDTPAQEADGSTELSLSPTTLTGKAGNWLRTVLGKGYLAILRLYSLTEATFDKSWKPSDIEKVKRQADEPGRTPHCNTWL
jgi:hypothetical protein